MLGTEVGRPVSSGAGGAGARAARYRACGKPTGSSAQGCQQEGFSLPAM